MDWFEEWFNSPLYEKLYKNRDETEAKELIALLEQTLTRNKCQTILDLACGRGRHSINLAQKGYDVTGVDLSEEAIKTAKETAKQRNVQHVHFDVHDMREPLEQTFDAIINLFTSFGYFLEDEANAAVFDNVAGMLPEDGIFIIDYLNAQKVKDNFVPAGQGSFKEIHYEIERYIENDAIHKEITFKKGDKQKTYSERVKLYDLEWFKREMNKRNLSIDHAYGDYAGNEFDPDNSSRLMLISHLEN